MLYTLFSYKCRNFRPCARRIDNGSGRHYCTCSCEFELNCYHSFIHCLWFFFPRRHISYPKAPGLNLAPASFSSSSTSPCLAVGRFTGSPRETQIVMKILCTLRGERRKRKPMFHPYTFDNCHCRKMSVGSRKGG